MYIEEMFINIPQRLKSLLS